MAYNKYSDGKIYKIINDEEQTYIGSTISSLNRRFWDHKSSCKTNNKPAISKTIFEGTNPRIELIEDFSCETKKELLTRENWYIRNMECINLRPAIKDDICIKNRKEYMKPYLKSYYEENRDKLKKQNMEYYEQNKERISTKGKEEIVCECGDKLKRASLKRHLKTQRHLNNL